jgi:hypothetical protein
MPNFKTLIFSAAIAASFNATAALESRMDGKVLYDPENNISWLANADLFGQGSWDTIRTQIVGLNGQNYLGFSDWRLPTTDIPDGTCSSPDGTNGYGCKGSEMGKLFYIDLGGTAYTSIAINHNEQYSLFKNIRMDHYWSETISPIYPGPFTFVFSAGAQDASNNYDTPYYAFVVRTGDVTAVPEPSTGALYILAFGLGSLLFLKRFRVEREKDVA